jgi:hypothetical protein
LKGVTYIKKNTIHGGVNIKLFFDEIDVDTIEKVNDQYSHITHCKMPNKKVVVVLQHNLLSQYGNDYQNITENPNYKYYSFRISEGIICCPPHSFVQEI